MHVRVRVVVVVGAACAALIAAASCSTCSGFAPCTRADECPGDTVCAAGTCVPRTGVDAGPPDGGVAGEGEGAVGEGEGVVGEGEGVVGEGEGVAGEGEGVAGEGEGVVGEGEGVAGEGEGVAGEGEGVAGEGEGVAGEGEGVAGEGEGVAGEGEGEGEGAGGACNKNGVLDAGETCDSSDGCAADCKPLAGFECRSDNVCFKPFLVAPAHVAAFLPNPSETSVDLVDVSCGNGGGDFDTDNIIGNTTFLCGVEIPFFVVSQGGNPPLLVVITRNFTFPSNAAFAITGGRAFVLVAFGDVRLDGTLEASGKASAPGPGAASFNVSVPACELSGNSGNGGDGTFDPRIGAGGGGSYSSGGSGTDEVSALGNGGHAVFLDAVGGVFAGGCRGGSSGTASNRALGGGGGGAVQISASGDLAFTGVIKVGGGGGAGGSTIGGNSGGGGGGAGGVVLLEARNADALIGSDAFARVTIGGGGGGQGAPGISFGLSGDDGVDGGLGGAPGSEGAGGDGGGPNGPATDATLAGAGGGGGGGGGSDGKLATRTLRP